MQEEIHQLLLSFAEAGANVVRLKGGDPLVSVNVQTLQYCLVYVFNVLDSVSLSTTNDMNRLLNKVFGRGGEEMDFLQQQGIEVKVIPGE